MTKPNQSELREHLSDILTGWLGGPEYNGFATSPDWGDLNTEIIDYITANYTPNSEVVEREQEAYKRGYIDGGIAELTKDVT